MIDLTSILWTILIFAIAAIPLHIAVRLLGGRTNFIWTIVINIVAGLAVGLLKGVFATFGGIIAFIVLLFVYQAAFRIGLLRAFFVWLVTALVLFLFWLIFVLLLGITFFAAIF